MQEPSREIGKWLITVGGIFIIVGALLYFGSRFLNLGRLPGDIHLHGKNYSFYFPIVTSIVISIILTIILNLFARR